MVRQDQLYFPKPEALLEKIQLFSRNDDWGGRVLALERALRPYERRGSITGFRPWLLSSELSRCTVYWDSLHDLISRPNTVRIPHALHWLYDWPVKPARVVHWGTMRQEVMGNTMTLTAGSFRKILTPAHIEFIRKAVLMGERAQKNVLIFEPQQNIADYKQNASVFPYPLRTSMLAQMPLIDIVVQNRRFKNHDPFISWRDTHKDLRCITSRYQPVIESFNTLSWKRLDAAGRQTPYRIISVWEDDPDKPPHLGYSTSIWESQCTGEKKFVDMAMRFLVTGRG